MSGAAFARPMLLLLLGAACGGEAGARGSASSSDDGSSSSDSAPAGQGGGGSAGEAAPDLAGPVADAPAEGALEELVACNPLSEWRRGAIATPARVEARGSIAPRREEVLVVGSQSGGSDSDLRVFIGAPPLLKERRVVSRERTRTPPQDHRLLVELDVGTPAELIVPVLYPGNDDAVPQGLGTLILPSETLLVDPLPRTALSMAGQRFECLESDAGGWQLSNEPAEHAPVASCAGEYLPELHCFSLFEGGASPDAPPGEQRFEVSVVATGTGAPPLDVSDRCYQPVEFFTYDFPEQPLVWARVARGPELGLIVLRSPGLPLPFAEGDSLRLEYTRDPWQPREALAIRSADGALLIWSSRAVELGSLNPPAELEITRGAEECPSTSGCYFTSQYAYDIAFAGERHQISFAEQAALPGYVFTNIGLELPTAQIPSCADGQTGRAWAELWATPAD